MKFFASLFIFGLFIAPTWGQDIFTEWEAIQNNAHLQFLASDELKGRDTGEPGNDIAARYIAVQFEAYGLKTVPGMDSYLQPINLARVSPQDHQVEWNGNEFEQGQSFLALSEDEFVGNLESVFINHGKDEADYEGVEVEGKLVISIMGDGENKSPQAAFGLRKQKTALAQAKGAMGIVEIFALQMPWKMMTNYMGRGRLAIDNTDKNAEPFFYGIINLEKEEIGKLVKGDLGKMHFNYPGMLKEKSTSNNVLGYIEGTDPTMKADVVLLSAHYDHVGTGTFGNDPDTIFNGARDNGIGVVAVLSAAKTLAKYPPKRSVIFAAWTGEEKGLLGSRYFVENSPVELKNIRFNLNSDGAGYDDTTLVSIMGLTRVGAEKEINEACEMFNLKTLADPAPEQGLFDRSDNVNFAKVGIPAPTFSPGFAEFSKEISKYYHRPGDHFDNLNLNYLDKFWKAFTQAGYNIANMEQNPKWIPGDKYESAAQELYGEN